MTRIQSEKETVEWMIRFYCRHKENNRELCQHCRELIDYAHARLDRCPFGEQKKACSACTIHCYKPDRREQIRNVMRFAGPRMLFYHPIKAIRHLIESKR